MKLGAMILVVLILAALIFGGQLISGRNRLVTERNQIDAKWAQVDNDMKRRADLIHKLDSNSGLAAELTFRHVAYGDWRRLFTDTEQYAKITADDVKRVAKQYFMPDSRTVVYTVAAPRPEATHD